MLEILIIIVALRLLHTFGMEEYIEVNECGYEYITRQVKKDIRFSDFLGPPDVTALDGYPVLGNVEKIGEFASLFRMDYDKMRPEGMDINTLLKEYLSYGEFEHTDYHPVKDFLSGLLDITIIIPIIECILGKDIITGGTPE